MATLFPSFELYEFGNRTQRLDDAGKYGVTRKPYSLATKQCDELIDAAENNNLEAIKHLLDHQHVPIYWVNANRQTAAHIAIENSNLVLLEYLLKKDAATLAGAEDRKYRTPLHLAAALGNLRIVRFLIEKCKLPSNLVNSLEVSVLYMAAAQGEYHVLVYLVEHGADVNFGTFTNDTPLHVAARKNHLKIVQYLVERGSANVNVRNVTGDTPLHEAVKTKNLDTVKYLIEECKASPLVENAEGENALHVAVFEECYLITEYLVRACNLGRHRDLIQAYIDEIPDELFVLTKETDAETSMAAVNEKRSKPEKAKKLKKATVTRGSTEWQDRETQLLHTTADEGMKRGAQFERHLRALQTMMVLSGKAYGRHDDVEKLTAPFSAHRSLEYVNVAGPSRI